MKIKVKVTSGKYERNMTIVCYEETDEDRMKREESEKRDEIEGGYDKRLNFKWLGMVASQRFAMEAPRGAIRRFDEPRGITDRAQQLPQSIIIAHTQEEPNPEDKIQEFLRDNDEVIIRLMQNDLSVDKFGSPKPTTWSTSAFFSQSEDRMNSTITFESKDSPQDEQGFLDVGVKSKIEFMKVILGSQMLDHQKIDHQLSVHFAHVTRNMKNIPSRDMAEVRQMCLRYYSALFELFQKYSTFGKMTSVNFQMFIQDVDTFSNREQEILIKKDFLRASNQCDKGELHFGGFLCLLLLASQTVHIDKINKTSAVPEPAEAFKMLFDRSILPYAFRFPHQLDLKFIVRETLSSDDCLLQIQHLHEQIFAVFDKYASKRDQTPFNLQQTNQEVANRDLPSLSIAHMADLLNDARLLDARSDDKQSLVKVRKYMEEVRSGDIIGRYNPGTAESKAEEKSAYSAPPPRDEFTYAEFVDACARSGIEMYIDKGSTAMECILKGLQDVSNATQKVSKTKEGFYKR